MKVECRWGVYFQGKPEDTVLISNGKDFVSVFITGDTIDVIELKLKMIRRRLLEKELDDIMQKTNTSKTK